MNWKCKSWIFTFDCFRPIYLCICSKSCVVVISFQEMKLNTSYDKLLPHLAQVLVQLTTCLGLKNYTITYLKDYPSLSSIDLAHWNAINIHSKVQVPSWFPTNMPSVPRLLTTILDKGVYPHTVFYLPHCTQRLETLVKVFISNSLYHPLTIRPSLWLLFYYQWKLIPVLRLYVV